MDIVISIISVIVAVTATIIVYLLVSRPVVIPPPVPVSPPEVLIPSQVVQTLDYPDIVSVKISDKSILIQTLTTLEAWFQYSGPVWSNKQIITNAVTKYDISSDGSTLIFAQDDKIYLYVLSTSSYNFSSSFDIPPGTNITRIKVNTNGSVFMILGETGIFSFNRIYRRIDNFNVYQLPLTPLIISTTFKDIAVSGNGAYVTVISNNTPAATNVQTYKFNGVNYVTHSFFQANSTFGNRIELDTDATRLIGHDDTNIYVYSRTGTNWSSTIIGQGIVGNIIDDGSIATGTNNGVVNVYVRTINTWQLKQSFQISGTASSDINNSSILVAVTPTRVTIYAP